MNTFTLEIELGNAAMLTGEDLGEALERVARKLRDGFEAGAVNDLNGNHVGHYELAGGFPESDDEGDE